MTWLTPCFLFSGDDVNKLNHEIWETIVKQGRPLQFGGPGEKIKNALHIHATVQFYGKAITDLAAGIMPDAWWYRGQAVREYMKQFDDPNNLRGFEYTYAQRLWKYRVLNPLYPKGFWGWLKSVLSFGPRHHLEIEVNQLDTMFKLLAWSIQEGIASQRIVAITFRPLDDRFRVDTPCLQEVKVYLLQDNEVGLECCYRSHDYANGYLANAAYLIYGFNKYVIEPAGGKLVEFIFDSQSAQLYLTDLDMVYNEIGWPKETSVELPCDDCVTFRGV